MKGSREPGVVELSVPTIETLSNELAATRQRIATGLSLVAEYQDWRPEPEAWSFRYIAAHLAVTEEECFAARLQRLLEEDKPLFAYYDHANRNFDERELLDSLAIWKRWREMILDNVRGLASDDLQRSGMHAVYGELSVTGLLQLMLDHDREHEAELETLLEQRSGDMQSQSAAGKT